MRLTKQQYITRIRKAQSRLDAAVRRNLGNTFVEQIDSNGLVRQCLAYNNYTHTLQSRQTLEYDGQGRMIHSVDTGEYWREEMVSIHADGIHITHRLKIYNEIGRDDEYIIMVYDDRNCVEATYSYTTGRLLTIQQELSDEDCFINIDFNEDGSIREYLKERLSD